MTNVLVNPSEHMQEVCRLYVAGQTCKQIAQHLSLDISDVYSALLWLDTVVATSRQVRPDEWETVE